MEKIEPFVLALSGKMRSGKDTVAQHITENVYPERVKYAFFAKALKEELTEIISLIRVGYTVHEAADRMGCTFDEMNTMFDLIEDEVISGAVSTGYDKTVSTRLAIQHWGTGVRRKQDDSYWVKQTDNEVRDFLADGFHVIITDARFNNELDVAKNLPNSFTVRLNVSREKQLERIAAVDGIVPSPSAFISPSETSLDLRSDFDAVYDTDVMSAEGIAENVVKMMREKGVLR